MFYLGIVVMLVSVLKPRWQAFALLITVFLFGVILHVVLSALAPDAFAPLPATGSVVSDAIRNWLIVPINSTQAGNLAFLLLIAMVLGVTLIKKPVWRFVALVPTLYLLAFVWETRLSEEPSVTRLLFVGVLLIVLMIYRPNGLLGQRRVEVV